VSERSSHHQFGWPAIAVWLALLLLVMPVFQFRVGAFGSDMAGYLERARLLLEGNYEMLALRPAYETFLALSYLLFGVSAESALWVTKLALVVNLIFLYGIVSQLYDLKTGLLAVALVATSQYMMGFPVHMAIDQAMTAFMLLSLWLLIGAFEGARRALGVGAGIALAIAMLVKDAAILWLPLPIYLFGGVSEWRCRENFKILMLMYGGFLLTLGGWMTLFYALTDGVYMESTYRWMLARGVEVVEPTFWLILASVIVVVALLALVYTRGGARTRTLIHRIEDKLILLAVLLLWFVLSFLFSYVLGRWSGRPLGSPLDMWPRLLGFADFVREQTAWQPLLAYLGVASMIVFIDAVRTRSLGGRALFWLLLSLAPLTVIAFKPRYAMPFYWVAYIILGRAIAALLEWGGRLVDKLNHTSRWAQVLIWFGTAAFVAWGAWSAWRLPGQYPYDESPYYRYANENAPELHQTVDWLRSHASISANVTGTSMNAEALSFFGRGAYKIHVFNRGDIRLLPGSRPLQFFLPASQGRVGERFSGPTYFQPGRFTGRYAAFSTDELMRIIQETNSEFLILSLSSDFYRSLNVLPDYILDHPAFQMVYSTSWQDRERLYQLQIFEIEPPPADLAYNDGEYPVTVVANVWPKLLLDVAETLNQEESDVGQIVEDLFDGGPMVFRPASPDNFEYYAQVAEAYAQRGDWDRAAFEYHLALSEAADLAPEVVQMAEQWANAHPEAGGVWLLLGDVRSKQGDATAARAAYEKALAMDANALIESAAHAGLARLDLEQNNFDEAVRRFDQALAAHIFGASTIRVERLLALAALRHAQGRPEDAASAYREAIELAPMRMVEEYVQMAASTANKAGMLALFERAFEQALSRQEMNPDMHHPDLFTALARFYMILDRPSQLARVYEATIAADEGDAETWVALAEVKERLGRYDEVIAAYEAAIGLNPSYERPYRRLMTLYAEQDKWEDLMNAHHKASMAFPNAAWPHLLMGRRYLQLLSPSPDAGVF